MTVLDFTGGMGLSELVTQRRRFYFDPRHNAMMVWVNQGDYYVTQNPTEVITTVLGSCVAVCARDPDLRIGGMNHFLLPEASEAASDKISSDLRYGSYSIERLINSIMSHGGRRDRLEIKIFGGAVITSDFSRIGEKNADFIEKYLVREGFVIAASDLRGSSARRVMYYPATGKALVNVSRDTGAEKIFDLERNMQKMETAGPRRSAAVVF
jgi:chemotaxis protein CheD